MLERVSVTQMTPGVRLSIAPAAGRGIAEASSETAIRVFLAAFAASEAYRASRNRTAELTEHGAPVGIDVNIDGEPQA